jgi:hypothetical protein
MRGIEKPAEPAIPLAPVDRQMELSIEAARREARATFVLDGIGEGVAMAAARSLSVLVDALEPGERIDVVYRMGGPAHRAGSGERPARSVDCSVVGYSPIMGDCDSEAITRHLQTRMTLALPAASGCAFRADHTHGKAASTSHRTPRWRGVVRLRALMLPLSPSLAQPAKSRSRGPLLTVVKNYHALPTLPHARADRPHTILLPDMASYPCPDFDETLSAISQLPYPVELAIRHEAFALNSDALRWLGEARGWLDYVNRNVEVARTDGSVFVLGARERHKFSTLLSIWLRERRGHRMALIASASAPVPAAYLTMLGRAVFSGAVTVCEEGFGVGDSLATLDLGDAFPAGGPTARALAAPAALHAMGFPRAYLHVEAELADDGMLLGRLSGAHGHAVHVTQADRARHVYIIGATGCGKSTLLHNMIVQDMRMGEGVCLIDPHGDLYRQVLDAVPRHRAEDVIAIDPGDPGRAVGINFLEVSGSNRAVAENFVVNEMMQVFARLYNMRIAGGPGFESYMRNAMLLLLEGSVEPATLVEVPLLFHDADFRRSLIKRCGNPLVANFWTGLAENATGEQALCNWAPYITNKLNQFVSNALLRPLIGQRRSTVDFHRAMNQGRIVLVNLSKGVMGELDSRLLGMLVLGKLFAAALSRARMPRAARRPMHVYIDEFQNVTTDTAAVMLAEARKFGLHLVLANQTLGQIDGRKTGVLQAVLGNVATMLIMRLGAPDAERMACYVQPDLSADDLRSLPDHHVAARLVGRGRSIRPFVFETLPAEVVAPDRKTVAIIARRRRDYTEDHAEVEADIRQRLTI